MSTLKAVLVLIAVYALLCAAAYGQTTQRTAVKIVYNDGSEQVLAQPETPLPPAPAPLDNASRLGANIDTQDSNSTFHLWADASKSAWAVGANGGALNQVVFVEQKKADGVYTVVTQNPVSIKAGSVGGSRTDVPGGSANVHNVTVPTSQPSLQLLYSAEPGAVQIWRPGYGDNVNARGPPSLFTNEAKAQLKPFGRIRFMDLLGTNGSSITTWDSRPKVSDSTWGKSAPLEICLALCNETGKNSWLNIPHGATRDYIEGFRALCIAQARPDIQIIVEYGNEITFNNAGVFGIARSHLLNQTRAAIAGGDLTLTKPDENAQFPNGLRPDGTARNETYAMWRFYAKRCVEIKALLGPRFQMVLAGQNAEPLICKIGLEFIATNYGPPADHIYAIATAPYFGISKADQLRTDLTPDQFAEALYAGSDPAPDKRAAHRALADKYGVKFLAYECGTHTDVVASPQAAVDAQMLPRTGEAVEKYLNNLFGSMDECCYFVAGSNWGWKAPNRVAVWGLTPGTHLIDTPKWRAAAKVAGEFKN